MTAPTVSDWGERRLIAELAALIPHTSEFEVGVGDDAAVFDIPIGHQVVVSTDRVPTDLIARRLGLLSAGDLGRYLIEVNASDIIAMGAQPRAFVLNLGLTPDFLVYDLLELVKGAVRRSKELGASIVGGDTKMTAEDSFVAMAVGSVKRGTAIRRDGTLPGDRLCVSGSVGGFGAALSYFSRKDTSKRLDDELEARLLEKLTRPRCRIDLADRLNGLNLTACIDITDGLAASVHELETAGGCTFDVILENIPVDPSAEAVCDLLALDLLEVVFGIGLDLELLGCVHGDHMGTKLIDIGVATRKVDVKRSRLLVGELWRDLPGISWEHFAGDANTFVTS